MKSEVLTNTQIYIYYYKYYIEYITYNYNYVCNIYEIYHYFMSTDSPQQSFDIF